MITLSIDGNYLQALASTVASSVADLFLFLRQMQCIISTEVSPHINLLNRLRLIKRAEAKVWVLSEYALLMTNPVK